MATPAPGLCARDIVDECRRRLLYIRLVDEHAVRIAVKGRITLERMMCIIREAAKLAEIAKRT